MVCACSLGAGSGTAGTVVGLAVFGPLELDDNVGQFLTPHTTESRRHALEQLSLLATHYGPGYLKQSHQCSLSSLSSLSVARANVLHRRGDRTIPKRLSNEREIDILCDEM